MAGDKNSIFHVVIEKDRNGVYIGSVSELPGCLTQARSIDELIERIKQAAPDALKSQVLRPMAMNLWGYIRSLCNDSCPKRPWISRTVTPLMVPNRYSPQGVAKPQS